MSRYLIRFIFLLVIDWKSNAKLSPVRYYVSTQMSQPCLTQQTRISNLILCRKFYQTYSVYTTPSTMSLEFANKLTLSKIMWCKQKSLDFDDMSAYESKSQRIFRDVHFGRSLEFCGVVCETHFI